MSLLSEGIISNLQREANQPHVTKVDLIKGAGGFNHVVQNRIDEELKEEKKAKNNKKEIDPKMYDDLVKALKGDMEDSRDDK